MKRAIAEQVRKLNFKEKVHPSFNFKQMKYILMAVVSMLSTAAFSTEFDSKINEVVVFRSGAEIYRSSKVELEKGNNTIELVGLSQYVDKNTIQAKIAKGKIVALDYEIDYLKEGDKDQRIESLKDSIEMMEFKLKTLKNESNTVEQELKLIKHNIDIKGQAVLDVADLEDFLIFYRNQLPLILSTQLNIETNKKKINKDLKKLKAELRKHQNAGNKRTGKVILEVASNVKQNVDLELNYYMRNAGWEPSYNLRSENLSSEVKLEFQAEVRQQSGVDWNHVDLVLATGTPSYDGEMPIMHAWYIDYSRPRPKGEYRARGVMKAKSYAWKAEVTEDEEMAEETLSFDLADAAPVYSVAIEKVSYREYHITDKRVIPSSNKKQSLDVKEYSLAASYNYFAAPKLSCKAFLLANVVDWDEHNLLSGKMNIYLDGRYVGKNHLNVNQTNDTLKISMGQDKDIVIERTKLKDKAGKQLIGLKKTKKMDFEISVRNTKNKAVNIEIVDQLPISKNDGIKVESHGIENAILDKNNKQVKWILDLQPAENQKLNFGFEITYPRSKTLQL